MFSFRDILYGLASVGELQLPQSPTSNEDETDQSSSPEAVLSSSSTSSPLNEPIDSNSSGTAAAQFDCPLDNSPALTSSHLPFTLPMHSHELGQIYWDFSQPGISESSLDQSAPAYWDPISVTKQVPNSFTGMEGHATGGPTPTEGMLDELFYDQMATLFTASENGNIPPFLSDDWQYQGEAAFTPAFSSALGQQALTNMPEYVGLLRVYRC